MLLLSINLESVSIDSWGSYKIKPANPRSTIVIEYWSELIYYFEYIFPQFYSLFNVNTSLTNFTACSMLIRPSPSVPQHNNLLPHIFTVATSVARSQFSLRLNTPWITNKNNLRKGCVHILKNPTRDIATLSQNLTIHQVLLNIHITYNDHFQLIQRCLS